MSRRDSACAGLRPDSDTRSYNCARGMMRNVRSRPASVRLRASARASVVRSVAHQHAALQKTVDHARQRGRLGRCVQRQFGQPLMRLVVQGDADPPLGEREAELLELPAEGLPHARACTCKQVRDGSLEVVICNFVCNCSRFRGLLGACPALLQGHHRGCFSLGHGAILQANDVTDHGVNPRHLLIAFASVLRFNLELQTQTHPWRPHDRCRRTCFARLSHVDLACPRAEVAGEGRPVRSKK